MAEKNFSLYRKQWIVSIFAIMLLSAAFIITAKAQQSDEPKPKTENTSESKPNTGNTSEPKPKMGNSASDRPSAALPDSTDETTDNTASDLPETDYGRSKRVKPERTYYFTAQYAQLFDDNVLLREQGGTSDIIYVPQIGFGAVRVRPRSLMSIDYLGGAEIHQKFSDLDGALHSINASFEYDLTKRTTLIAREQYLQRPVTAGFGIFGTSTNVGPAALNVLVPTKSKVNDLSVVLEHQLSKPSRMRVGYGYTISRSNNELLTDTDVHVLELGYTRKATQTFEFDLEYRASFFMGDGNLISNTLMPSLNYKRKSGLRFRLGAGPQLVTTSLSGDNLFLAAVAEIGYNAQRTVYTLSYAMGVGEGGGIATVTRNKTLFGAIERQFGNKLRAEIRLGYSRAINSIGKTSGSFLPAGSVNNGLIFESRVDYRLWDRTGLFFSYLHSVQNRSNALNGDLNRNLFTVGISFDTRRSVRRIQSDRTSQKL